MLHRDPVHVVLHNLEEVHGNNPPLAMGHQEHARHHSTRHHPEGPQDQGLPTRELLEQFMIN